MTWLTIITGLLDVFGPVLADWLKHWLESHLNKTAARLPPASSFGTSGAARERLLDAAVADLPRFAFARRALLRFVRRVAPGPLTDDQRAELADLSAAAEDE